MVNSAPLLNFFFTFFFIGKIASKMEQGSKNMDAQEYGTFPKKTDNDKEELQIDEQKSGSNMDMSLVALFLLFLGFGCRAWGGPAAQIAMLKESLVVENKWITLERFNRVTFTFAHGDRLLFII